MLQKLKKIYISQSFKPTLLGIFTNPYYITRLKLFKSISDLISHLYLSDNQKIVDLGCGSSPYKQLFTKGDYIGIDVKQSGHSHQNENIDIFYDGKNLPFDDLSLDVVFSSQVFEHIEDLEIILAEVFRTLKNNGKIIASIPFVWNEHEMPYDFRRFTSVGVLNLLEKHGFSNIKIKKDTNFIESLFQITIIYVWEDLLRGLGKARFIFLPLIVTPLTVLGLVLSKILPNSNSLFLNTLVYAEKNLS